MKLLYIVPSINDSGGVSRTLSIKINYFIEKMGYEVHLISQNEDNFEPFYSFNSNVNFHSIFLKGSVFSFGFSYIKQVKKLVNSINPDFILVADNGLKAFLLPYFLSKKVNLFLELHSVLDIKENQNQSNYFAKKFKQFSVSKFKKVIVLSKSNVQNWKLNYAEIIPNPLWLEVSKNEKIQNKAAICFIRDSYIKGFDRLISIWNEISKTNSDWNLKIIGISKTDKSIIEELKKHPNLNTISFIDSQKDIENVFSDASILLQTSRFEAFPMILIEAMGFGLTCVAYNCPGGTKDIISNNVNGFLIKNDNQSDFVAKTLELFENENLRKTISENAKKSVQKFDLEVVMQKWVTLFEN